MGIDLPRDLGTRRLSWGRLARIIEHLPADSATVLARTKYAPSLEVAFLRRLEFWMHINVWAKTKDGEKNRNQPVMVPLAGDAKNDARRDSIATDELLARRMKRREAELAAMETKH